MFWMKVKAVAAGLMLVTTLAMAAEKSDKPAGRPQKAKPQLVILEADIANDPDEDADLAVAAGLANLGEIKILGLICNSRNKFGLPCGRAELEYYGITGVTYGMYKGSNVTFDGSFAPHRQGMCNIFRPGDSGDKYTDATKVMRTLLHDSPDGSVKIVNGGFASVIAQMLASPADNIDKRSGVDLIKAKVSEYIFTAVNELPGSTLELWNIKQDIKDARYLTDNWPASVPLTWVPYSVGGSVRTGPPAGADPKTNPVKYYFDTSSVDRHLDAKGKRNAWHQVALLYAARPNAGYFTLGGKNGKVTIDDKGNTAWDGATNRGQRYLQKAGGKYTDAWFGGLFDKFMAVVPKPKPTGGGRQANPKEGIPGDSGIPGSAYISR